MKKLLGTTAIGLALAVSPAMAGPDTDVDQLLSNDGSQTAATTATGNNVLNMDQSSSNLGNLVDKVGNYDDILQDADIPQAAQNILIPEGSSVKNFDQSSSNTANYFNIIDGTTGDVYDDFTQTINAGGTDAQKSINRIEINDEDGPNLTLENVTQSATNNGNYANIDDAFNSDTVFTQIWANDDDNQVARNAIVGAGGGNDDNVENALKNVEQTAGNYANMLFADDFRDGSVGFKQEMGESVDQTATNTAWFELYVTETDQVASNTANYADVNGVEGTATQKTGNLADQVARNALLREDADNDGSGSVTKTTQSASNFGNIFKSVIESGGDRPEQDKSGNQSPDPKVEKLEQYFGDSQRATNVLSFGDKLGQDTTGPQQFNSSQDATNVMNMAEVQEFDETLGSGTLAKQTAEGEGSGGEPAIQLASNNAFFEGGGSERGNVTDFSQSASNLANLMYSGNLPSFGVQEFDQTLKVPQLATSTITTIGNLTSVSQSSSNVGNVLSDLE